MLILKKNFDGQHFMIKGYRRAKLDCMFFPCTDEKETATYGGANPSGDYLNKPTFIICSPNALVY